MKRSGFLKRSKSMKRSPLRRKPRPAVDPRELEAAAVFHDQTLTQGCCASCGQTKREVEKRGSWLEAHHAIRKQALKKHGLKHLLWDPRNGVALCNYPCHDWHTDGYQKVAREALPPSVEEFAAEIGLPWMLDREYA